MKIMLRRFSLLALLAIVAAAGVIGEVQSAPRRAKRRALHCGQVVRKDTTLRRDLGPCPRHGLLITENRVTVNLNGHKIFGEDGPSDGVGVVVGGSRKVVVKNGTISEFGAGVAIQGGGRNVVKNIEAVGNVGTGTGAYGDGIAVDHSKNNRVVKNTVTNNGPFTGIGLPNGSTRNLIRKNVVKDNSVVRTEPSGQPGIPRNETNGIRLESESGHNRVIGNRIEASGQCGLCIVFSAPGNVLKNNVVLENGTYGIRFSLFSDDTLVEGNTVIGNGFCSFRDGKCLPSRFDGIQVRSNRNLVRDNLVTANGRDGINVQGGDFADVVLDNIVQQNLVRNNNRHGIAITCTVGTDFSTCLSQEKQPALSNQILNNNARGNGAGGATNFDLFDQNFLCDSNVWRGNKFDKASPDCTKTL